MLQTLMFVPLIVLLVLYNVSLNDQLTIFPTTVKYFVVLSLRNTGRINIKSVSAYLVYKTYNMQKIFSKQFTNTTLVLFIHKEVCVTVCFL